MKRGAGKTRSLLLNATLLWLAPHRVIATTAVPALHECGHTVPVDPKGLGVGCCPGARRCKTCKVVKGVTRSEASVSAIDAIDV